MPVWKALASLALLPLTSAIPAVGPQVYGLPYDPRVPIVDCVSKLGTGFRVGPRLMVSVAHVTAHETCTVDDMPVTKLYENGAVDFSMLAVPDTGVGFREIDCDGFKPGHRYTAIGHARAEYILTAVRLYATEWRFSNGQVVLKAIATMIPGQSGGPVIDNETGKVVGIVNTYDFTSGYSGSRELKTTPLCEGRA